MNEGHKRHLWDPLQLLERRFNQRRSPAVNPTTLHLIVGGGCCRACVLIGRRQTTLFVCRTAATHSCTIAGEAPTLTMAITVPAGCFFFFLLVRWGCKCCNNNPPLPALSTPSPTNHHHRPRLS